MGRPPKYDWEDKRDICYRLHVEQKLSGSQIVQHFADHFGVPANQLPGVNQFYARFRLWGFPSRKNWLTDEDKERIVERTRELFNQNVSAQDTLSTLQQEGWDIDRYQFRVLRKKHGMILRSAPGYKKLDDEGKKRKRDDVEEAAGDETGAVATRGAEASNEAQEQSKSPPLPPEEAARRAQRLYDLQVQSDELLQTRKRRRRIRGYGHLPPDAPGMQPRYNSETSLDECKAYLHLTNDIYVDIRRRFADICNEMGIVKMTLCQEGQWQAAKDRLVLENAHLSSVLEPSQTDLNKRWNALNCICTDVTKRMRNQGRFMSIADANNALQLNPADSKEIRRLLYDLLAADHFTSMITCGKDRMDELRQQWYSQSPFLQQVVAENEPQQTKALDVLCKDVRKRFSDDQSRKDPNKKQWQKQSHYGPGPGPAQPIVTARSKRDDATAPLPPSIDRSAPTAGLAANPPTWNGNEPSDFRYNNNIPDQAEPFDLDPLLTTVIRAPPWPPSDTAHNPHGPPPADEGAVQRNLAPQANDPQAIATYFRLSPSSNLQHAHPNMWLGRLASATLPALQAAALSRAGQGNADVRVGKIQGIVKNAANGEDAWLIETDDELGVYLAEAAEKPTFVVQLESSVSQR